MTVWHMGPLHPAEQALVLALAFGPFLVLAFVIVLRRRSEQDEQSSQDEPSEQSEPGGQRDR